MPVAGTGTINASVRLGDGVATDRLGPGSSPGLLTITGDYTQTSSGVLDIEIGGLTPASQFDQLFISGLATLAGVLNVLLIDSFMPSVGDSFTVIAFGSRTGDFASCTGCDLGGGLFLQRMFTETSLILVAQTAPVPEPSTYLLLASALGVAWWWRWRPRATG